MISVYPLHPPHPRLTILLFIRPRIFALAFSLRTAQQLPPRDLSTSTAVDDVRQSNPLPACVHSFPRNYKQLLSEEPVRKPAGSYTMEYQGVSVGGSSAVPTAEHAHFHAIRRKTHTLCTGASAAVSPHYIPIIPI